MCASLTRPLSRFRAVNAATLLLGVESHHKQSVPRAPTKEEVSLRAYTARRRLNHLRHAACRLFTSENMVKAIKKLEGEIAARRLAVRRDRHLWKDVGTRGQSPQGPQDPLHTHRLRSFRAECTRDWLCCLQSRTLTCCRVCLSGSSFI